MDTSEKDVECHHLKCIAFEFSPLTVAKSCKAGGIHDSFGTDDSPKTFLTWMEELNLFSLAFNTEAAYGHKHKQGHSQNDQVESRVIGVG